MDIRCIKPSYVKENFLSFCSGRGVTSEGDAEEVKQPFTKPVSKHRVLRYPATNQMAPLATFGDIKVVNEQSEGNKSFNMSAKSLGKINVKKSKFPKDFFRNNTEEVLNFSRSFKPTN
jgi:hypothetical protein